MPAPVRPRRHRHHLNLHRPRSRPTAEPRPIRLSDPILALLGVALLGGLGLLALASLVGRALAP